MSFVAFVLECYRPGVFSPPRRMPYYRHIDYVQGMSAVIDFVNSTKMDLYGG